jgi:hypothetical protein
MPTVSFADYAVYGLGPEMSCCVTAEGQLNVRKGDSISASDIYLRA